MGHIIAALDLGTSKSIAIVVRKDFSGKLSVVRTETLSSKDAIRRGRVYHSDETSDIISKLIRKLNNNPETMLVEKIYVGIGGQSLHTHAFNTKKTIKDGIVTQQLLDLIEKEANDYEPEFEKNLGIASREYYADGQLVSNPKGTLASVIEAQFQLVVSNPCLKLNLENVFKGKDISVADYFISPLATAEAVLTKEEKESGCALVEFGAGVSYVSVYKNKRLKYAVTLPLGGLAITKDIRSLNVSEEEAEKLKIKYGSAIPEPENNSAVSVNEEQNSSRKIELKELNEFIEARVDEIVKNVWNQIQLSGYAQTLDAGIVITGGGALLRNLSQSIRNQTGKTVRLANAKAWINQAETQISPADSCVVGLALLGKENCAKEKETVSKGKQPEPRIFPDSEVEKVEKTNEKKDEEKSPQKPKKNIISQGWKNFKGIFDEGAESLFTDSESNNDKNKTTTNK